MRLNFEAPGPAQTPASDRIAERTAMNDDAPSEARVPIIACHECGLIHRMRELPDGRAAKCTRCGAVLYRERRDSLERVLMLTIAALILYVLASSFPFLTFKLEGQEQVSTLLTGVVELYRQGHVAARPLGVRRRISRAAGQAARQPLRPGAAPLRPPAASGSRASSASSRWCTPGR